MPAPKGKPQGGELCPNRLKLCEAVLAGASLSVAYESTEWLKKGPNAKKAAWDIMQEPEVQVYLAVRRMELREKTDVRAERLVAEIASAAFWDPAEYLAEEVNDAEDIKRLPEHVRKLIQGWKWDKFGNFVVTFVDKQKAQDMLAKHLGLYQAARLNDQDSPEALLGMVMWRYVVALHAHEGVSVAEALNRARSAPMEVERWGRSVGLIKEGEIVVEANES